MGKLVDRRARRCAEQAESRRQVAEWQLRGCIEKDETLIASCAAWRDERGRRDSQTLLWLTDRALISTLHPSAADWIRAGAEAGILMKCGKIAKISLSAFNAASSMRIKPGARSRGLLTYVVALTWAEDGMVLSFYFEQYPNQFASSLETIIEMQQAGKWITSMPRSVAPGVGPEAGLRLKYR